MSIDSLGRRSRFSRHPTGKRIVLTARDTAIFRLLYRYRYLRVPQLLAFLQPRSEKRFIERLGDLFHETGLIDRPKAQWRVFDPRSTPLIYELSAKGKRYLTELGEPPQRATSLAQATAPGRAPQFEHAMMIVDTLAGIELATLKEPDQRFVPVGEILERAPETSCLNGKSLAAPVTIQPGPLAPWLKRSFHTHLIPDGLFGIEYLIDGQKLYRFWALECENQSPRTRSTVTRSSLALKKAAYDAFISGKGYRGVWGIPNLKVRVVGREPGSLGGLVEGLNNCFVQGQSGNDCKVSSGPVRKSTNMFRTGFENKKASAEALALSGAYLSLLTAGLHFLNKDNIAKFADFVNQ